MDTMVMFRPEEPLCMDYMKGEEFQKVLCDSTNTTRTMPGTWARVTATPLASCHGCQEGAPRSQEGIGPRLTLPRLSLLEASYNLAMVGFQSQSLSGSLALCSLFVLSAQLQCQLIATAIGTAPPVAPALHL